METTGTVDPPSLLTDGEDLRSLAPDQELLNPLDGVKHMSVQKHSMNKYMDIYTDTVYIYIYIYMYGPYACMYTR